LNADMAFVENAADSLRMARDWINTPAGDFGPAQLAAAARQLSIGTRLLSRMGRRGVAGGELPGDSRSGAREQRGTAAG